ncbi:LCP family protein [Bacillus testis]|uniref:LCP family protein n=1 Tax=Bacillus testis TaxID=1622072 RepID=UPI00067E85A7|nr:LCP family protein [Bacillus testis]
MNRIEKRKRKKKKIVLCVILIITLLILLPTAYFAWDYYKSYSDARKESSLKQEDITFNGDAFKGKMNVLLVGVDSRGEDASNSDSMMIAQYDTDTKKAKLVSLMRDMYVDVPGKDKKYKLNAAYLMGGPELLRKTIKENFDIDLNYYAILDFNGFIKGIDKAFPDGIEVNVEHEMSEGIWVTLEPGVQRLHGKELLGFARFRKDAQSDFGRVKRQQEVIEAITKEMVSVHGVTKLPGIIGTIQPYFATNISKTRMISVLTSFLMSDDQTIDKLTVPVEDSYEEKALPERNNMQVLEIDVEKNKKALEDFLE